jgi:hypothetical protein
MTSRKKCTSLALFLCLYSDSFMDNYYYYWKNVFLLIIIIIFSRRRQKLLFPAKNDSFYPQLYNFCKTTWKSNNNYVFATPKWSLSLQYNALQCIIWWLHEKKPDGRMKFHVSLPSFKNRGRRDAVFRPSVCLFFLTPRHLATVRFFAYFASLVISKICKNLRTIDHYNQNKMFHQATSNYPIILYCCTG